MPGEHIKQASRSWVTTDKLNKKRKKQAWSNQLVSERDDPSANENRSIQQQTKRPKSAEIYTTSHHRKDLKTKNQSTSSSC